jgi:hypothetical protein
VRGRLTRPRVLGPGSSNRRSSYGQNVIMAVGASRVSRPPPSPAQLCVDSIVAVPHTAGMAVVWLRMEIMGSQNYRNVGESQPVLIMIDPIISTRTRTMRSNACEAAREAPPPPPRHNAQSPHAGVAQPARRPP